MRLSLQTHIHIPLLCILSANALAGNVEERDPGLPGDGLGQQRLARPRGPHQQHSCERGALFGKITLTKKNKQAERADGRNKRS